MCVRDRRRGSCKLTRPWLMGCPAIGATGRRSLALRQRDDHVPGDDGGAAADNSGGDGDAAAGYYYCWWSAGYSCASGFGAAASPRRRLPLVHVLTPCVSPPLSLSLSFAFFLAPSGARAARRKTDTLRRYCVRFVL